MADRRNPKVVVRRNVACQSSRNGAAPVLIVIHDTEGANLPGIADLAGLAAYFDRTATQASSHVATDADGTSSRMVADEQKAWHCAYYNSVSLGIEQIGFASQSVWPDAQLRETARWVAYWSRKHGIPIQTGHVSPDGKVLRAGLVRHSDLGNLGGGHHDPGDSYPMGTLLALARHYRTLQRGEQASAADANPADWLTKVELEWCREYDRLKRARRDSRRRAELQAVMTERRKLIWRKAQPEPKGDGRGWEHAHRRDRYHSLAARTR